MKDVYCIKCKSYTPNKGEVTSIETKNGRSMVKVRCATCGNMKSSFIKGHTKTKSLDEKVGGCDCEHIEDDENIQDGDGLTDIIERVKAFFKGPRNNYAPTIRSLFEKISDKKIVSMQVCRSPIQSVIQKILDLVTLRSTPFDKLFHLYGLMKLDNGETYRFEKNQVIGINKYGKESDADCIAVPLGKQILFGEFFMKSQTSGGSEYFQYDGFKNNCQDFILGALRANGLLSSDLSKFIKQNVEKLVPSFVEEASRKVTDLAGMADSLIHGEGMKHGLISTPNGMKQIGFNKY